MDINQLREKALIYVSSKFQGKEENVTKVERYIKFMVENDENKEFVFVSPIHSCGFLYNDVDYQTGLDMTLAILMRCDAMCVIPGWDEEPKSVGVQQEIDLAIKLGIPIYYIPKD